MNLLHGSFNLHYKKSPLKLQAYLAKVAAGFFVLEGVGNIIKSKRSVDDGMEIRSLDGANHIQLMGATAYNQTLEARLEGHQFGRGHLARGASQHTNQRNVSSQTNRIDGLRQSSRPTNFDHVINTSTVG